MEIQSAAECIYREMRGRGDSFGSASEADAPQEPFKMRAAEEPADVRDALLLLNGGASEPGAGDGNIGATIAGGPKSIIKMLEKLQTHSPAQGSAKWSL